MLMIPSDTAATTIMQSHSAHLHDVLEFPPTMRTLRTTSLAILAYYQATVEGRLVSPNWSLPPCLPPRQRLVPINPPSSAFQASRKPSLPLGSALVGPSTASPTTSSLAPPPYLSVVHFLSSYTPTTPSLSPRSTIPFTATAVNSPHNLTTGRKLS